jgi:hypothetical protein
MMSTSGLLYKAFDGFEGGVALILNGTMTADLQTFGFPAGYFVIRSVATQRLWDVDADEIEDGTGE